MTSFARSVTASAAAFALMATGVIWLVAAPSTAEETKRTWVWEENLLGNPDFDAGLQGWALRPSDPYTQTLVTPGLGGSGQAIQITATSGGVESRLDDDPRSLPTASAGAVYRATVNVRPIRVATAGSLVLTEWSKDWKVAQRVTAPFSATPGSWTRASVPMRAKLDGSRLQVSVVSNALTRDQQWDVDALSVRLGRWVESAPAPAPVAIPSPTQDVKSPDPTPSPTQPSPDQSAGTTAPTPTPTPDGAQSAPSTESLMPAVCGTWVVQQASGVTELDRMRAPLLDALNTPGVRGLSIRVPWNRADGDLSVLARAHEIATEARQPLSIRIMAGRHTPARILDAGAFFYRNSGGERIPKPFSDSGVPGNPVFERAYDQMVTELATWSRANDVQLLHLPWYGRMWAEIDNGSDLQSAPGYSLDAWTTGHLRLLDTGLAVAGSDLAVEYPMSGHWGSGGSAISRFHEHIIGAVGDWSPRIILQGNGLGVYPLNPTGSRPIYAAAQMYDGGQYDWSRVYTDALTRNALYIEVYTSSFTGDANGALAATIKSRAAAFDGLCENPR